MSITSKAVTRMVLDMGKVDVQKSVAFTKGDVNRRWEVTLVDNGSPFDVPNNWTVALSAIKPDGNPIYNGCVVEHGRIVYDFASGEQLVTSEGVFAAEFDVFDETGQPVCTPRVWIQVLPVARNLAPIPSDPQFTLLRQFLERAGDLEEDITEMRDDMGRIVQLGKVTVSRAAWRGSPLSAVLSIPGLPRNSATLLYPADAVTRAEAAHSEIAAWVEDVEGHDPVITLEAAKAPSGTLTLIYANIKSERTGRPLSVAAIMGVGGGDSEPGSLRYVSDGKGRVTVLGKMVETTDATARHQIEALRKEFEQGGGGQIQRIEVLEGQVADLMYKPMVIESFSNNVNTAEMGSTVTAVTLSWSYNKLPEAVTLDGATMEPGATGKAFTGLSIRSNKTWTLKATDERGAEATRTTGISFLNGVYYGAAAAPSAIDSGFIRGLAKTLRGTKLSSFTVNAEAGRHIFYCVPKRFGTCSFTVGGFDGGFDLAATVSFTNGSGYTEDYYVYRSTNAGLGNTTVGVR